MVNLIASHIVKPAKPIPTKVMFLSECDQRVPVTHVTIVHFYKPEGPELLKDATGVLKESLSEALVAFHPLAGRLYQKDGGRVELQCNSMGALLVEAQSELKIQDFGDFCPTPQIRALIPPIDNNNTPLHEIPLLLAQITKFACGGVSIGLAVSHVIADGHSGCHFVSEWAKIARGEKSDDQPFLDRTIFQKYEDDHPSSTAPILQYSDFFPLPVLIGQSSSLEERKKATICAMLKFSKDQIEQIRNKANYQDLMIHKTSNQSPFSRFVAVSAHIWKCLSQARMHNPAQETVLYVNMDFRNRLKLPLPGRYFGNAVLPVTTRAIVGNLQSRPLSYASSKIKEAIENVTDEYVRSYLVCMKNIPEVSSSRHFHAVGCPQGLFLGNPNLIFTTWVGLGLYKADFGWGNQIFLTPGSVAYDGKLFIIPSPNGDGSLFIPLCLQAEHINAFKKHFYDDI
ncbi:hydroxycinnamoyl-CoA:piscidic acid hydroxycinnamoyltransferase-like [Coffea arabica]|uniref:Hydroxycinnamoyl-CoA:piscidic acid hydroxycinnamoyltransferase-like n=1 Tax=Coffea arabica TaxID=13443 RepID=A0ABM4UC84_COFAR|nr:spermidine hydroxycinnamoyl transferase-like [Coffea arabica]